MNFKLTNCKSIGTLLIQERNISLNLIDTTLTGTSNKHQTQKETAKLVISRHAEQTFAPFHNTHSPLWGQCRGESVLCEDNITKRPSKPRRPFSPLGAESRSGVRPSLMHTSFTGRCVKTAHSISLSENWEGGGGGEGYYLHLGNLQVRLMWLSYLIKLLLYRYCVLTAAIVIY